MSGEPKTLTHSVDIDLRGVTKLKSVTPEPSDQGVVNGETAIFRFRVKDGERITLDTGRRQFEVVVNPRAGGGYPVVARDEAAELKAAITAHSRALRAYLTGMDDLLKAIRALQAGKGPSPMSEDFSGLAADAYALAHTWGNLQLLAGGENEK